MKEEVQRMNSDDRAVLRSILACWDGDYCEVALDAQRIAVLLVPTPITREEKERLKQFLELMVEKEAS
jgi:hypothetical protein